MLAYLSLIAMYQNGIVARFYENVENLGNTLNGNKVGVALMCCDRYLEMLNTVLFHKERILHRVSLTNERAFRFSTPFRRRPLMLDETYRMVLRFRDFRCSKLPAMGKPLRYIPGATRAKLVAGPVLGDGGPLSSALWRFLSLTVTGD